ncbi:hypothetical protein [Miltoncostaea marina]|uniref:hypothetical protein n=1 Tax=Miltoncostaea marina TaxID=2843215 RepID=UPI001C3DC0CA|nr:hypothetical protein [Miltoncostaea marina]
MLDDPAGAVAGALTDGGDPATSRRCARAVERYERASAAVAGARTRRELDLLVARHRLRAGAARMALRGLERLGDAPAGALPAPRR